MRDRDLRRDLVVLLVGFTLTTVVGGYLTYEWQKRADTYQRAAECRRDEKRAATAVFEEISRLMDRRLYRMRRVDWGRGRPDIKARWDAYREVLNDWNENLNRNLALVQRYFGDEERGVLENEISPAFRRLGRLLERKSAPEQIVTEARERAQLADQLNIAIYRFDVQLIEAIQSSDVGSCGPVR